MNRGRAHYTKHANRLRYGKECARLHLAMQESGSIIDGDAEGIDCDDEWLDAELDGVVHLARQ